MRWLSLYLACQHLNSASNLRECEDQSWFKVQAVPVFRFDSCKICVSYHPRCLQVFPGLRVSQVEYHVSTLTQVKVHVTSECLTIMNIGVTVFCDLTPCRLFDSCQQFRVATATVSRGERIINIYQASRRQHESSSHSLSSICTSTHLTLSQTFSVPSSQMLLNFLH
jgi:hypothetical protein